MTTPAPGAPGAASAKRAGLVYKVGLGVIVAVTALQGLLGGPEAGWLPPALCDYPGDDDVETDRYAKSSSVMIRSWSGGSLTPRLSLTVAHT